MFIVSGSYQNNRGEKDRGEIEECICPLSWYTHNSAGDGR
jgi:hypothetical protein